TTRRSAPRCRRRGPRASPPGLAATTRTTRTRPPPPWRPRRRARRLPAPGGAASAPGSAASGFPQGPTVIEEPTSLRCLTTEDNANPGRRWRRKSLQRVQGTADGQAGGKRGDQGDQYDLAEHCRIAGPADGEGAEQGADLVLARRSLEPAAQEVGEAEHRQR